MTSAYACSEGESVTSQSGTNASSSSSPLVKQQPQKVTYDTQAEISLLSTGSSESSPPGFLGKLLKAPNKVATSKPLHQFADQSDEDASPQKPNPNSSSWGLSPSISSIPEEKHSEERPPRPQRKSSSKHVIAPFASFGAFSPQSQRSLAHSNMDNSSVAQESASGVHSEATCGTGLHSELTEVMKNTSGMPIHPKRDIETGPIPIQQLSKPPLSLIPSHRILEMEQDHVQPEKERKQSICRGTQGWIIGLLVALFVFGMITVVVSFVLSQKEPQNIADSSVLDGGEDDFFAPTVGEDDTIDYFSDPLFNGTASMQATNTPSYVPSAAPSLDKEAAELANMVEELLQGTDPSSSSPSASPSLATTTKATATNVPTASSSPPSQRPTTQLPSTPSPTTLAPTVGEPLLHLDASFSLEAQVQGENGGDAAGSSIALSSNGRILLVGSPNADSPTGVPRAGQVHIYERVSSNTEWTFLDTIQGEEELNQLGFALATNHDGSIVAVSEPTADNRRGRVTIYTWQPDRLVYEAQQVLRGTKASDHFGISISLSDNGRRLAVGSPYHSSDATFGQAASNLRGQVQVFEYSMLDQTWDTMSTQEERILLGAASLDWFGWSVSLSKDGQFLSVGAPRNTEFGGYVQCFFYSDYEEWELLGPAILNVVSPVKLDDRFGHSTDITNTASRPEGGTVIRVAIGSPNKDWGNELNSGMVAIYEWNEEESTWLLDNNGGQGGVIAEKEPGFYHQLGYSIAMEGDMVAVGIPGWDSRRGMVNLFWLPHAFGGVPKDSTIGNPWDQLSNPLSGEQEGDDFGFSVASALQSPSSLMIASGAIMVSTTESEATGYAEVYQLGTLL